MSELDADPCPFCGHREWAGTYESADGYPWESCGCGYRSKWGGGLMMDEFPQVRSIFVRLNAPDPRRYGIVLPPGIIGTFATLPESDWQEYADHARLQFVAKKIADPSKPYSFRVADDFDNEYHYIVSTAIAEFFIAK